MAQRRQLRGTDVSSVEWLSPYYVSGTFSWTDTGSPSKQVRTAQDSKYSVRLKNCLSVFLPSSKPNQAYKQQNNRVNTTKTYKQQNSRVNTTKQDRSLPCPVPLLLIVWSAALISTGWTLLLHVAQEYIQDSQTGLRTQAWWAWLGGEETTLPMTRTGGSRKNSLVGSCGTNSFFSLEGFPVSIYMFPFYMLLMNGLLWKCGR